MEKIVMGDKKIFKPRLAPYNNDTIKKFTASRASMPSEYLDSIQSRIFEYGVQSNSFEIAKDVGKNQSSMILDQSRPLSLSGIEFLSTMNHALQNKSLQVNFINSSNDVQHYMDIPHLPNEIWELIIKYVVDPYTLKTLRMVCSTFNVIVTNTVRTIQSNNPIKMNCLRLFPNLTKCDCLIYIQQLAELSAITLFSDKFTVKLLFDTGNLDLWFYYISGLPIADIRKLSQQIWECGVIENCHRLTLNNSTLEIYNPDDHLLSASSGLLKYYPLSVYYPGSTIQDLISTCRSDISNVVGARGIETRSVTLHPQQLQEDIFQALHRIGHKTNIIEIKCLRKHYPVIAQANDIQSDMFLYLNTYECDPARCAGQTLYSIYIPLTINVISELLEKFPSLLNLILIYDPQNMISEEKSSFVAILQKLSIQYPKCIISGYCPRTDKLCDLNK